MLVLHFWFLCYDTKMTENVRTEQFLGSYPTQRRTVTADISPRSENFSGKLIV